MEQELINLLTLTEYFLIKSEKTKKPYSDENGNCYLFEVKSDAEAFAHKKEDVKIENAKSYRMQFIAELYGHGIKGIKVKQRNKEYKIIPVDKKATRRQYANPDASFNVMMLNQTRKKKYAKELKNVVFITPVLIDPRFIKRYPEMHYSYATFDGNERFYVLFTSLKEFTEWNNDQEQDWKPVEMKLQKVGRIRKNSNILINPLSDKIILQDKQINEILKS